MEIDIQNKLTYKARKKSNDTIQSIPKFDVDEKDLGIENGYMFAKSAIKEKISEEEKDNFKSYFQRNVHLIHYQVPKDIDLNHYFEIMNSRGEQLEKHEIIKARLIEKLKDNDKSKFNLLWENCSEMNVYIQQKYRDSKIFGSKHDTFSIGEFDDLPDVDDKSGTKTINDFIVGKNSTKQYEEDDKLDSFQPILDFSNFLLIVLKLTRMDEISFESTNFILDDKELINEFDKVKKIDEPFVKKFAFNLLMAKFLLDNFIVHHSNEDETKESNPWKLQYWHKDGKNEYLKNLDDNGTYQDKLVHLLSMFEVSFTARQRKNYLFYCLLHLFNSADWNIKKYYFFMTGLAEKYFKDVYLVSENLNEINTPKPGSFDENILIKNQLDISIHNKDIKFNDIYGDGTTISKGIPLFIFNYIDYKLWENYADIIRGKSTTEGDSIRNKFFNLLGCNDFGLKVFDQFYFSRTRRSLEHYYAQSLATGQQDKLTQEQINCLGNFAMIGSEANSSGSNWSPKAKLDHYLDSSGKIKHVSVASIKFMIMMQVCKNNQDNRKNGDEWNFNDIKNHQKNILNILGISNVSK